MAYTRKTWAQTIADLETTFDKWGIEHWRVEPRTGPRKLSQSVADRTVTVLWQWRGQELALTMGERLTDHDTAAENLRAIYNSIEALRLIEVRGTVELMRDLFKQLPAPSGQLAPTVLTARTDDAYRLLGVDPAAPLDVIEAAHRVLLKRYHPDRPDGDAAMAARVNAAMDVIRTARG